MAPTTPSNVEVPTTLIERVHGFVGEHKQAVLLTAAAITALAAGGAIYYASSSSSGSGTVPGSPTSKSKKKKSKGGKGKKDKEKSPFGSDDGPILEERKPKDKKAEVEEAKDEEDYERLSNDQLLSLPTEERIKIAAVFKAKGNAAYQARTFPHAAELYTRAIQISPKPEPVFYSNRAACYVNMSPPKHDLVVLDCDAALKLDHKYVKALNRRAMALEGLGRLEEALRDFTAATILDKFQNQSTANAVERVLKTLATDEAKKILDGREARLPSFTFISAYFAAFRPRTYPGLPESPTQGDETLQLGLRAMEAADYIHAVSFINEAIDQGISTNECKAEAYNLRGTFKFLMGEITGAKEDLEKSLELFPSFTQSLVKLASVHMEQGDPQSAFTAFANAETINANDPDIWYHRGQVLFIMSDFEKASEEYKKSLELDPDFVFSHIQLAVAKYKMGDVGASMAGFRRALREFPNKSEPSNYYGELLLDQGRFEESVEKFERAIELEKNKAPAPPNVLPLVNKGLALYQWKQDIAAAERCCNEALRIDDECEAAVATLAQLSLQQGKNEEALKLFERQSELARSEVELVNALTYLQATKAQVQFMTNYPDMAAQLSQMAGSMMMG